MGNYTTKVDKLGLAKEIQTLITQGLTGRGIAARVKADHPGIDISDSAIIRYVSQCKSEAQEEAFVKIKAHVDRVVPDDLKALEEMEAQCLGWAREAGKDRIDRMAEAAAQIRDKVEDWRVMLLEERDADGQRVLVRRIIRECLELMAREDRLQTQRDRAMNTAIKIIDLKLRQAGLLDDEGKGRIVIVDREAGASRMTTDDGYESFVVPGEQRHGEEDRFDA